MKLAFIGMGLRASHLAYEFKQAAPQVEIVAATDPQPADKIIDKLKVRGLTPQRWFTDPHAMLQSDKFDLVVIASPNYQHLPHIELALNSDTEFIFTEKPVVTSIADTLTLVKLLARHNAEQRVTVGLTLRYSPLFRSLQQAYRDGVIGEIMSIEASEHIAPYHGAFFKRDWRRNTAYSGGFLLEKCCHDLDLYQHLLDSRPERVASFGGVKKYRSGMHSIIPDYFQVKQPIWNGVESAETGDIVDYQVALIEFANEANLVFHTNLNVPDEFRHFCVIGTDAMAEGDFIRQQFKVTRASDSIEETGYRIPEKASEGLHYGADRQMAKELMAFLTGDATNETVSIHQALEAGITALAIEKARQTKTVVELKEIWQQFDQNCAGKH